VVDGQELVPGVRTIKDSFVSVFLLDAGDGKVVLIDAGNDKHGGAIRAELARRKLDDSAVAAIFLTHGHGDHTAAARTFPKAEIHALTAELDRIGAAVKVTHPLADGDKLTVGDLTIETFAVPGHTAGSAVYLAKGVLFFGDSAGANEEGIMTPAVRLFSSDPAQNLASLKALATRLASREAEIKVLAFAHSGPLDGLAPLTSFATR
jgi:glyoxylase-like metal-dependent hydrolase (beta-lactamase superfamily II)